MSSSSGEARRDRAAPPVTAPAVAVPKGGGAIRGIGEKFAANPVTGTASMSVPIATSPGRSGFGPQLSLSYDSGAGNGPFGFGWSLSLPSITRKTDKGLPAVPRRRGVRRLHPLRRRGPRARPSARRHPLRGRHDRIPGFVDPPLPAAHRGAVRPHRALDGPAPPARSTGARSPATTSPRSTAGTTASRDLRSRRPGAPPTRIFSLADLRELRRQGQRHRLRVRGGERRPASTPGTRQRAQPRRGRRTATSSASSTATASRGWSSPTSAPRDVAVRGGLRLRRRPLRGARRSTRARPSRAAPARARLASPHAGAPWAVRPDPFSSHRAGFEVRTYRRCRRVLMFHHFPDLPTGEPGYDGLVRVHRVRLRRPRLRTAGHDRRRARPSGQHPLRLVHSPRHPVGLRPRRHAQPVVERDGVEYVTYLERSLPPLEFEYSKAVIQDEVRELDAESLENLPVGRRRRDLPWVDLDGEGLSGILTEQAGAWFYKPNLGDGRFGPLQVVAAMPSLAALTAAASSSSTCRRRSARPGQPSPARRRASTSAPTTRTGSRSAASGSCRTSRGTIPNLRFVDLDGDGHADVLITERRRLHLVPVAGGGRLRPGPNGSPAGRRGARARGSSSPTARSPSTSPTCAATASPTWCASATARSATGRTSATAGSAPRSRWTTRPGSTTADQFDQRRVRLADIDGSGTDRHHLPRPATASRVYFNQSGNRLERAASRCPASRASTTLSTVATADLLGNGTACLVWSSPLPADARRPLRYIDLMGGTKPHLLVRVGQQPRRGDARAVRAVDPVLPRRQARRAGPGSPACRSRSTSSSGSIPTTASAATASSPATPTTTATSTASSASSAASAWSSSGTPRSSRR